MRKNEPDIKAEIRFLPQEQGGLKGPIFNETVGSILQYQNENFDCFLLIPKKTKIYPGETIVLPIIFLYPELIKSRLSIGDEFTLRDYRSFAEGTVREICK